MKLSDVIDLDNLHKYSNINASTIIFDYTTCGHISKFDYAKYNVFIDVFNDVNQLESDETPDEQLTFVDNMIYIMYRTIYTISPHELTINQKIRLLFKLIQRGSSKSIFDDSKTCAGYSMSPLYWIHKVYLTKYYDTIINLFRLTNSVDIDICNLDDTIIDGIRVLLLIAKSRIVPKYVVLHKILLFYFSCQ